MPDNRWEYTLYYKLFSLTFEPISKFMSTKLLMSRIGGGSTLLLIFMAMFVPTAYVPIKAGLLLLSFSLAYFGVFCCFLHILLMTVQLNCYL